MKRITYSWYIVRQLIVFEQMGMSQDKDPETLYDFFLRWKETVSGSLLWDIPACCLSNKPYSPQHCPPGCIWKYGLEAYSKASGLVRLSLIFSMDMYQKKGAKLSVLNYTLFCGIPILWSIPTTPPPPPPPPPPPRVFGKAFNCCNRGSHCFPQSHWIRSYW